MRGRILAATLAAAVSMVAPAHAAVIQDFSGFQSATNGIVLGPDGNFWVAEQFNNPAVTRMTPTGQVLKSYPVGAEVTSLAADAATGRVWASVTGASKLIWFDATSASPTAHDKLTGSSCDPVAIESGNDGNMYFSLPDCGQLGRVAANGSGSAALFNGFGSVFDLAVANGVIWAPDFDSDVVQRRTLPGMTNATSVTVPHNPDGIAVGAGFVWVTEFGGGRVARFPPTPTSGAAQELVPTNGSLGSPFGIVAAPDGNVYVTGKDTHNLARISADGTYKFYDVGEGEPWQIVAGLDGDLYFTDQARTRVRRFLSAPPRAVTGAAAGVNPTTGAVTATVDSRGAATTVVFDYGLTTAYGGTVTTSVPAALGAASVQLLVGGLAPGTMYHVRVRAGNEEGGAVGADTTFTTLPGDGDGDGVAPPLDCNDHDRTIRPGAVDKPGDKIDQNCDGKDAPFPKLAAEAHFSWGFIGSRTVLTRVSVTKLKGGERIRVTCKGKGCPLKSKTYKKVKKGSKSLTKLFKKRKLRTGTKVTVRITKAGSVGSSAVLTVGKRKQDPKIKRTKVNP
jgi:streptogramin lyase